MLRYVQGRHVSNYQRRSEDDQKELERLKPFEAEVKEKSALLGKTRHEGVAHTCLLRLTFG